MQAKEFLSRQGIDFEYVDITSLDDPLGTIREITGGPVATPVIVVGEAHRVGFDATWIEEQLAAHES